MSLLFASAEEYKLKSAKNVMFFFKIHFRQIYKPSVFYKKIYTTCISCKNIDHTSTYMDLNIKTLQISNSKIPEEETS